MIEREAKAREKKLAIIEQTCPYIRGNPFIPHHPTPKQALFLGLHNLIPPKEEDDVFEALYGGAAGGGKSDALLMAVAQYAWRHGDFAAVCFRRTYQDLINPGALLDRAKEWWIPKGVHWNAGHSMFVFPSGAKVKMGHMSQPKAHFDHQGAEYHLTVWDELTQHPTEKQYEYVGLSRVRRKKGCQIPLRTLAASNPGGPGHVWVKNRFVGGMDPVTGHLIKAKFPFVPAKLKDNPFLDYNEYVARLKHLHPTLRAQLLNGDWDAREPGDYFRPEWFGPLLNPETDKWPASESIRVRWWDLAASESKDAARTAGVLMARHRLGVRAVEHAVAFRKTPGARDDAIVMQAKLDGFGVVVGLEIEGGSGGLAQFEALSKRLRAQGFRVVGARPRTELTKQEGIYLLRQSKTNSAKAGRADPVASCLERGHQRRGECPDTGGEWWGLDQGKSPAEERDGIRLFAGPWTQEYLDELVGFPDEAALLDLADATSGAWAWLEAHPFGLREPIVIDQGRQGGYSHDTHPDERRESRGASELFG